MKTVCLALVGCAVLSLFLSASATSAQTSLSNNPQQREQKFSDLTFVWQQEVHQHDAGMPSKALINISSEEAKLSAIRLRRLGMNEEQVQKALQTENHDLEDALSEKTFGYSSTWQYQRSGLSTLVSGGRRTSDIISDWRQLYMGDACLHADDADHTISGKSLVPDFPVVWQTPGESIRYASPLINGLESSPEDAVMLAGFSPLAMHSAKWDVIADTTQSQVLTTHYVEQNVQYNEKLTLDRVRDNAPTEIVISQSGLSEKFSALSFRKVNGVWIADKVEYSSSMPDGSTSHQLWTLQTTNASQPIVLNLSKARPVHDYRLFDSELNWRTINKLEIQRNMAIVAYKWPGSFPSKAALQELYKSQHPGEAAPDPKQASSLPFAGGLMMLLGGVWMFRRRGSSSS